MRIIKIFIFSSFLLFVRPVFSQDSAVFSPHSLIVPLSNFINHNDEYIEYRFGYLYNFNQNLALRFFSGFSFDREITNKPINTELDQIQNFHYFYFNTGLKFNFLKYNKLNIYVIPELSFTYRNYSIDGYNFSSISKSENIYQISSSMNIGFEIFILSNFTLSIEYGLFYENKFGNKTVEMGNIKQKDDIPKRISFVLKPSSNLLNLSFYF